MAEALKFIGNGYNAALVFGIALFFLGLLSPKKFFGIEVDWNPPAVAGAMVYGAIIIIGSLVLRAWYSDTVNIDKSKVTAIVLKVREAQKINVGALNGNADCASRATQVDNALKEALELLKPP